MKSKKLAKKNQTKYKVRRITLVVILAVIFILLLLNLTNKNNIQKIANYENALQVGGQTIDISKIAKDKEANPPTVGAGMIPIKWNGTYWEITTADDVEWYDYNNGKFANIMLSDGKYTSELTRGKEQAQKGMQVKAEDLGTIFTWIPRFAYYEEQIKFLSGTSILEYMYTTPSCFNLIGYGANYIDLGYEGMWIGQNEFSSANEVENKNTEMLQEENKQGLIANEKVTTLTTEEKEVIQKLTKKYTTTNETMLQNTETMQNRQVIKILNTNKRIPIMGRHSITNGKIKVQDKYSANGINCVVDKDGNVLPGGLLEIDENVTQYTFYIIDNAGNIRRYNVSYGSSAPDLRNFNKNTTFYVVYDENGNEISEIPIGEKSPDNWYDYDNQQWANIVVRDNGSENYYVWIPRYMYKINDDGSETVDAKIVDLANVYTNPVTQVTKDLSNSDYILPEAFTWEDPNDPTNIIQLRGFWTSKYKLRAGATYLPEISGGSGVIRVNNVVSTLGTSYTYEMYLIKDGKRIVKNGSEYEEGTEKIELTGNYVFTDLVPGDYAVNIIVKDSSGNFVRAVTNQVTVMESVEPNAPDVDNFNKNLTYYVTYDENGNEDSSVPIGDEAPNGWYNYDNQQWANIVVRDNGTENYYVWIPRYEYKLDSSHEATSVQFIATTQTKADTGYTIPEAFTWENPENEEEVIQLNGFWASKYKLRDGTVYNLSATVTAGETSIKLSSIVANVSDVATYEISLIKDGKILKTEEMTSDSYTFTELEAGGTYGINLVAKNADGKMVAGYSAEATLVKTEIDLSGFNKNTTYYVMYDENGNEESTVPIGEDAPSGWYDYADQRWANIVVRDNGSENYYVWIPRYQYIANAENENVKAEFIPVTKETADAGYTIPEAFTWENPDNAQEVVQLSGFWASKYKLREGATYLPEITGGSGVIRVNNVVSTLGTSYTYEMYLIKDGKRVQGPIELTENYVFKNISAGEYAVNIILKDSSGNFVRAVANQVTVMEKVEPNAPDLTGLNKNLTFYVTYDSLGNEQSSYIPIGENAPENWYDYDSQQWANIVVRENGAETYYTWIPRYEYKLDEEHQTSSVQFISTAQTEPDEGYAIPEAFTWEDPTDSSKVIQLSGFWINKYKLRDVSSVRLDATVAAGENKIRVSNIVSSNSAITYNVYLIKDGKKISSTIMTSTSDYTFTVSEYGTYSVAIVQSSTTDGIVAGFAKEVVLSKIEAPDLTGFNEEITYYVTYDSSGNEISNTPISQSPPSDWYDYAEQKWPNIVVRDEESGNTNYYVWIPRYEYIANDETEKVKAILIPKTQITADAGYTIPEAFTWEDPTDSSKVVQLSGFWVSKYKLRKGN